MQSLAYSMLYNFLRETICDARDVFEDKQEGLRTLPMVLGPNGTMVFLAITAIFGDMAITGGFDMESLFRSVITLIISGVVVRQPRENGTPWGFLILFGLLPAWWAQFRLL
jgi:4-hydroxybenzoate polyprenyltransferase